MPKEFEHAFINFNKKEIITKIKELNGIKKGTFLFKVQVLVHPLNTDGTYIRVRDEGHRITMTYKYKGKDDVYSDEHEVNINNFDEGVNILLGVGCKKKYYYEKIREIWDVKNTEIVFDTNPGIDDKMEVESKTKKELKEMIKYFNLHIGNYENRYNELFGIVIPPSIDLTFLNVKKVLLKHVKKNKKDFIKLVDSQIEKYNKL